MASSEYYTLLMNSDFESDDWELNEAWGLIEQTPSRESSPVFKSHHSQHQNLGAIELDHLYHRKDSEDSMECQPEILDSSMPATPEESDPELMNDLDKEPNGESYEHNINNECTTEDPDTANDLIGNPVGSVSPTGSVHSLHMDSDHEEPSNDWHECNSGKNAEGPECEEGETCFSVQDNISDDCSVILDGSENSLKYQQTKDIENVQDRMVVQVDHSYSRGSALCEVCGSFFVDQFSLEKHSTEHSIHEISDISSPYQEYQCPFCDYIALSETSFRDHQSLHIGSDLACVWCGISFNHQEQFEHHKCSMKYVSNQESVPENQQAACEQNVENITQEEESISGRKMLGESQQRQSNDGMDPGCKPQVDNCTYDDQNLYADTLKQEQSSMVLDPYAGPQPYLCEHCGSSFVQKYAFNVHMVVHRYKDSLPCGLVLKQKPIKKVSPIKPRQMVFKCQMCKQKFNSNAKLQRHKRIHRGDRGCLPSVPKYTSEGICDSTESPGIMSLSEQEGSIHLGQQELGWKLTMYGIDGKPMISRKGKSPKEGPSSAPRCSWAIKSPFDVCSCSLCGKKYLTPLGLKIHIKTKHRFSCNWCNVQAFSSEEELNNHLISHGVIPVQDPNLPPSVTNPESSPVRDIESIEGEPAGGSNESTSAEELKTVECANSNEMKSSFSIGTGNINHQLVQSEQTDNMRAVRECSPTKELLSAEGEPVWIKSSVAEELKPVERKESNEINGNCSTIEPSHQPNGQTNVIAEVRNVSDTRKKRFKCDLCGKSYERLFMLSWHMKSHPPPTLETPTFESRKTRRKNAKSLSRAKNRLPKQQTDVRAPVRKISTVVDTRFHCNLCGDRFYSDPNSLKVHIKRIHSGYFCDRCNMLGFSSRKQYKTHLHEKHCIKLESLGPKPPAPRIKSLSANEPKSTRNGQPEEGNKLSTEHAKSVQSSISKESTKSVKKKEKCVHCDVCDKDFARPQGLKRHIEAKHAKKRVHCDVCDKNFSYSESLKRHMKTHAAPAKSDENNERNGNSSSTTKDQIHSQSGQTNIGAQASTINAVREKHYNCDLCDKVYSHSPSLWRHMKEKHAPPSKFSAVNVVIEKRVHSDVCDRDFSCPQSLKRHMKTHTAMAKFSAVNVKEKRVYCDVCDRDFSCPQGLKRHMEEKHAPPSKFFCDKCDHTSFPSSTELKEHMKHHANLVSFMCDVCLFAFGSQKSLDKHKTMYHL